MNDDDDATVFQTEGDKKKLAKEVLSGQYDSDPEDDTTNSRWGDSKADY